jgi:small GTP-binding protein
MQKNNNHEFHTEFMNIGILGSQDSGKTSVFVLFLSYVRSTGNRIIQGNPGGVEIDKTMALDFVRFTYKGMYHTLYGTGGHKLHITEYYRKYVLRTAQKFLIVIDMSIPIPPQLKFLDDLMSFNNVEVSIVLNKMDLPNSKAYYSENKNMVEKHFIDQKAKIKSIMDSVAIQKPKYVQENKNAVKSILNLIDFTDEDPFSNWVLDQNL